MSRIDLITDHYPPFGSGLPRTPGTHVSSIIRAIQEELGLAKKAVGWEMNVCADIGFLWEDALSWAYRDRRVWTADDNQNQLVTPGVCGDLYRPGEIVMDDIILSPDGYGLDPYDGGSVVDHEFKFTWRSSARDPRSDFYWDNQFMSYCRAMQTTVTVLHVMYCVGNWKNTGPQHMVYRIEYDPGEIEACWQMILGHVREQEGSA